MVRVESEPSFAQARMRQPEGQLPRALAQAQVKRKKAAKAQELLAVRLPPEQALEHSLEPEKQELPKQELV